jgi:hypothetical protein
MSKKPDLSGYKEVSERIQDFRKTHPEGSLQSEVVPSPVDGFVVVKGYAFRSPDDPRPGTGLAWEPVPGKTPYTKDSELQNAETSAWGRAIIAVGASDASKVASADEVRNRQEPERSAPEGAGQWLANAVQMFKEWSEDDRRETVSQVMKELGVSNPMSMDDARLVHKQASEIYYEAHPPSGDEAPF